MPEIDDLVREYIASNGIVKKIELCNGLDRAWSTIEDSLKRLEVKKKVKRVYEKRNTKGRPRVFFIIPERKNEELNSLNKEIKVK